MQCVAVLHGTGRHCCVTQSHEELQYNAINTYDNASGVNASTYDAVNNNEP